MAPFARSEFDHESVVNDLVAYVDGRPVFLERKLDDLDGPVDAGTKAARSCEQDREGRQPGGAGVGRDDGHEVVETLGNAVRGNLSALAVALVQCYSRVAVYRMPLSEA